MERIKMSLCGIINLYRVPASRKINPIPININKLR